MGKRVHMTARQKVEMAKLVMETWAPGDDGYAVKIGPHDVQSIIEVVNQDIRTNEQPVHEKHVHYMRQQMVGNLYRVRDETAPEPVDGNAVERIATLERQLSRANGRVAALENRVAALTEAVARLYQRLGEPVPDSLIDPQGVLMLPSPEGQNGLYQGLRRTEPTPSKGPANER